jgi:hypothetical protein
MWMWVHIEENADTLVSYSSHTAFAVLSARSSRILSSPNSLVGPDATKAAVVVAGMVAVVAVVVVVVAVAIMVVAEVAVVVVMVVAAVA